MNKSSRRTFLATTGAGAVAVGAVTIVPTSLAGAQSTRADVDDADFDAETGVQLADSVLFACVDDVEHGVVTVISGHTERTVTDHALAQRIAQLSGSEA